MIRKHSADNPQKDMWNGKVMWPIGIRIVRPSEIPICVSIANAIFDRRPMGIVNH